MSFNREGDWMRYHVEILEQPYVWENHYLSKKTAIVHFKDVDDRLLQRHEYAYMEMDDIHQAIRDYEPLLIEHAYIKDLSLATLRRVPYERIYIKQLEFEKCFIDGDTDLSTIEVSEGIFAFKGCQFGDGDFDIRGSRFLGGIFSFEETSFGSGNKYLMNCRFGSGVVDFSRANFGDGGFFMQQLEVGDADVVFNEAVFGDGMKHFRGMKVGKGDISFKGARFGCGDIDFVECNHIQGFFDFRSVQVEKGDVNFGGTRFGQGDKDFSSACFENGMVSFSNARFGEGNLYMVSTRFVGSNAYFNRAYFGEGDINFVGTLFENKVIEFNECRFDKGYLNFNGCLFGSADLDFTGTDFGHTTVLFTASDITGGKMQMIGCRAEEMVFSGVSFGCHVYMNVDHCGSLVLENCIIEKTFDLRPLGGVLNRTVDRIRLSGTKNLGHIYVDWFESQVRDSIHANEGMSDLDKAYQFRLLKENFRNIGQYDDEDHAYIEFKRCERKARYSRKAVDESIARDGIKGIMVPICRFKRHLWGWLNYFVFDLVGRYGTSPKNVFITMLNTVVFFTLVYASPLVELTKTTKFIEMESEIGRRFLLAFYHSVETFLTIGYGDVNPDNFLGVILSAFEGFCGVFLMSYFTIAFVRKLLR